MRNPTKWMPFEGDIMKRLLQIRNCMVLLPVLLAACSSLPTLQNDRVDYKSQSAKLPPLEIPPDLTKPGADDRFSVPDINGSKGQATASDFARDRGARADTSKATVLPREAMPVRWPRCILRYLTLAGINAITQLHQEAA